MKPIARWTIGPASRAGYECLRMSIESFLKFYDAEVVICHNCPAETIATLDLGDYRCVNQQEIAEKSLIPPAGVAWKLYPPRLDINRHEIAIDNDIVFEAGVSEIDHFFKENCTLLLEGSSRNYGRFENHVPVGYRINSGIYGMPPGFDLDNYVRFYCRTDWQLNAFGEYKQSKTFDEQGLVALALLSHRKFAIIPETSVTNCERDLLMSNGMHFVGLNRRAFHKPFALYKSRHIKMYM